MFSKKTKKYNVKKVIFSLRTYDDEFVELEVTGKLLKKRFLFWTKYTINVVDPEKIIKEWGMFKFIKVAPKQFIGVDRFKSITFKVKDFYLEK